MQPFCRLPSTGFRLSLRPFLFSDKKRLTFQAYLYILNIRSECVLSIESRRRVLGIDRIRFFVFLKRNKKYLTFQSPWNILIAEEENPRGPSSAMAQEPLILGWASSFLRTCAAKPKPSHPALFNIQRSSCAVGSLWPSKNRERTPHVSVPGFAYPNYVGFALIASARRPDRYRPSDLPAADLP